MTRYQECIDSIQEYMGCNGFQLAPEKTALVVFSRTKLAKQNVSIQIGDVTVQPSTEAKFLGVTLKEDLSFTSHVDNLVTKAMRGVNLIKVVSGEDWATPRSLIHLANALVRSRLTYGCESYHAMTHGQWSRLERVEMAALKAALGLPKAAVNDLVYQEAGWLPLREECQRRCANFLVRVRANDTTFEDDLTTTGVDKVSLRREGMESVANPHARILQSTTPISEATADVFEKCGIDLSSVAKNPRHLFPPWELLGPRIEHTYAERTTKQTDPLLTATLAREKIASSFPQHLKIYTDGSVQDSGETGCAFVIPDLGVTKRFKLNAGLSIFSAEMYAILRACEFVNDLPNPPLGVVILSDSKSSLQALERGGTANRQDAQREVLLLCHQIISKGTDLAMMWLPSHVGIRGNDLADREANRATREGTSVELKLTPSEIRGKVTRVVTTDNATRLKARCEEHGWIFFPGNSAALPKLPRRLTTIVCRIRTLSSPFYHRNPKCQCGTALDPRHLIKGCANPPDGFKAVRDLRAQHQLEVVDFLRPHPALGDRPLKTLATAIAKSEVSRFF
jgi:ribonuclease HI